MPLIASLENLHESFLRAVRAKSGKQAVVQMRRDLDTHLLRMCRELLNGTFRFGQYNFFEVTDQKRRLICAASFRERIVFQAMMRICHPVFDNFQCDCSFASRKDRGTYAALERAQYLANRYQWFAKLDVRKFFYTISHEVMIQQLCRLFKDALLLDYFQRIIKSYEVMPGRGLPIGNLTSQYFANHYLAVADHWAKEHLRVPAMVRYMDDVLLFGHEQGEVVSYVHALTDYINKTLRVELHDPVMNRTKFGIPFLGYVVYHDRLRLSSRSLNRYRRKLQHLTDELNRGAINEREYIMRAQCLFAFVEKADSCGYRHHLQETYQGIYP